MANRNVSWVPGARVHFGNLDFIITMEGELVWSSAATKPLLFTSLDAIAKALEELQLPTTGVRTPRSNQPLNLNYGRPHHDARDTPMLADTKHPLNDPTRTY